MESKVPAIMPIMTTMTKFWIVAPTNSSSASMVMSVVKLVFRERLRVSIRLWLTLVAKSGLIP